MVNNKLLWQQTERSRARLAILKIAHVFPKNCFGQLYFRVVAQAILDCIPGDKWGKHTEIDRSVARDYLRGEMYHAALVGVDPDYVRRELKQCGIYIHD